MFNKIVNERRDEISKLNKKVGYNNLAFHCILLIFQDQEEIFYAL